MSYYIIIRGPLGIGKSTVSKKLAVVLKGECFSIDDVLEKHNLDVIDEGLGCISLKNFNKATDIILPKIKKRLFNGTLIIIDGNFYYKCQLEYLENNLQDYKSYIFTLKAGLDTCVKRDGCREFSYGVDAARAVHSLVSKFDYGKVINTEDKTADEVVDVIIKQIEK